MEVYLTVTAILSRAGVQHEDHDLMERYNSLIKAAKILAEAAYALSREDGHMTSPAWTMVFHAQRHLEQQADKELRQI